MINLTAIRLALLLATIMINVGCGKTVTHDRSNQRSEVSRHTIDSPLDLQTIADARHRVVFDYDRDGLDDILFINRASGFNIVTLSGSLDNPVVNAITPSLVNGHYDQVIAGNFDDNPSSEILLWSADGTMRVLLNVTTGYHGTKTDKPVPETWVNGYKSVFAGKWCGHSTDDLLLINPINGENRIVSNLLDDKPTYASFGKPTLMNGYQMAAAGDFGGDRRDDLFLWTPGSGDNRLLINEDSKAASPRKIDNTLVNDVYSNLMAADFDGDGADDLMFYDLISGENRIILSPVNPKFQTNPVPRTAFNGYNALVVGRFDHNGPADIAGHLEPDTLRLSFNPYTAGDIETLAVSGLADPDILPSDPAQWEEWLQDRIDEGGVVEVPPVDFIITKALNVPSDTTLRGSPGSHIFMDAGRGFENDTPADENTALRIAGAGNVKIEGLVIRLKLDDGRIVYDRLAHGILVVNSTNVAIINNDLAQFSSSEGIICVDSSSNVTIANNYIHDSRLDAAVVRQLTGITVDNNIQNHQPSVNVRITGNRITNLVVSESFNTRFDFQTDGINIASPHTTEHVIQNNIIDTVGEGIDVFGKGLDISCNEIRHARQFAIKLIHGASFNKVHDNLTTSSGIAEIVLGSSRTFCDWNVSHNEIRNNELRNARYGVLAFRLPDPACSVPVENSVVANGVFESPGLIAPVYFNGFPNEQANNVVEPGGFSRQCN